MVREDEDLVAAAMAPSYWRLVGLHRMLDPMGASLLSVEQLVANLLEAYEDSKRREAEARRRADGPETDAATVNDETEERGMEREEVVEMLRGLGERPAGSVALWELQRYQAAVREAADLLESRWSAFSDEEVAELRAGVVERHEGSKAVPAEYREQAGRLATDLRKELKQRDVERPSYRGPGIYRFAIDGSEHGSEHVVVGLLQEDVLVRSGASDDGFYVISRGLFELRKDDGSRRYTWVRGLEER